MLHWDAYHVCFKKFSSFVILLASAKAIANEQHSSQSNHLIYSYWICSICHFMNLIDHLFEQLLSEMLNYWSSILILFLNFLKSYFVSISNFFASWISLISFLDLFKVLRSYLRFVWFEVTFLMDLGHISELTTAFHQITDYSSPNQKSNLWLDLSWEMIPRDLIVSEEKEWIPHNPLRKHPNHFDGL